MTNNNQEKHKNMSENDEDTIFIKKEALRNMITHVLRFGHEELDESVEVMGICLGHFNPNEKRVIIENAIPITHGVKVEVGFEKEDYKQISQIGEKYSSEIIGYYHSHPSWGIYLSDSDMSNMKFFQNEKRPYGFGIVFDHTLMGKKGNLGFEIYRLDDYKKADNYHKIEYEIEIPNTLEYFKWVQKFVEDFQKKSPILIKEINEFKEEIPGELQEIPKSEEALFEQEVEKKEVAELSLSGYHKGSQILAEILEANIKPQIDNWVNDITIGSSTGSDYLSKAIIKMKEAILSGLNKVNNWFKRTLDETVSEFKDTVSNHVDNRVENQKELSEQAINIKNVIITNLNSTVIEKSNQIKNELKSLVDSLTETISENKKISSKTKDLVENIGTLISNTQNDVNDLNTNIEKNIESMIVPFEKNITEKFEKMSLELQSVKDLYAEIHNLLEKLQTTITSFRNIV